MILASTILVAAAVTCHLALRGRQLRGPSDLKHRFRAAGNLLGLRRSEVIKAVGRPDTVSAGPFGGVLLAWKKQFKAETYEIVLMFDAEGRCPGISHEVDRVRGPVGTGRQTAPR